MQSLLKLVKSSIWHEVRNQEGSAITEFLLLTLPLFLPLIIFLTDFSTITNREVNYQTIARQAVRAFVSSPNASTGIADVQFILKEAGIADSVDLDITCLDGPCFTPKTLVRITLSKKVALRSDSGFSASSQLISSDPNRRNIVATVYERFDRWFSP